MLSMLFVRKRSSVCDDVIVSTEPPWPAGRVSVCVRVGLSTVCESEYVFMMSMNVSCKWRLFVWGITGWGASTSGGSNGEMAVQSMSGRLKSPVIHMCLSACMRERECWKLCK